MKILQTLAIAALVLQATLYVQPDVLKDGDYRVYDDHGKLKETWKADPVIPGNIRVFDHKGKFQGDIRPDPINPGNYKGWYVPRKGAAVPITRSK